MIEIKQNLHNLIGSEKDIKKLEEKDMARILVISDSHGNSSLMEEIIEHFGPDCDALVFCGDGITDVAVLLEEAGHNKNLKKAFPPVAAIVQGNGDSSRYAVSFGNKMLNVPARQILTANHTNFLIVHGHREEIDWGFETLGLECQIAGCNYAFYGHTHVTAIDKFEDYTFINPGSISRPRGGQPACFAIATVGKNFVDVAHIEILRSVNGQREFQIFTPIY